MRYEPEGETQDQPYADTQHFDNQESTEALGLNAGTAHFRAVDSKQNTKENLALEAGISPSRQPAQVEDTFGMIHPEDIEPESGLSAERYQMEQIVTGDEGDQELFAHIVSDPNESETPVGLGVQAIRLSNGQYAVNRYESGGEVFAIEHDESSNQYTEYNDEDKITEAEAELEASNSPSKSAMKELTQGFR